MLLLVATVTIRNSCKKLSTSKSVHPLLPAEATTVRTIDQYLPLNRPFSPASKSFTFYIPVDGQDQMSSATLVLFPYVMSGTGPRAVGTERGRWS